jgi:hypothetical protein
MLFRPPPNALKLLATLRTDALLFSDMDQLQMARANTTLRGIPSKKGKPGLLTRENAVSAKVI